VTVVLQPLYDRLAQTARNGDTATYAAVAPLAALDMGSPADRNRLAVLLDEINQHESGQGRPLLTALVVLADKKMPGQGFFDCATRLGRTVGDDHLTFWLAEVRHVHEYWTTAERR